MTDEKSNEEWVGSVTSEGLRRRNNYMKCRKHGYVFQESCNGCWRKIWVQEQTLLVPASSHVTEVVLPESAKNLENLFLNAGKNEPAFIGVLNMLDIKVSKHNQGALLCQTLTTMSQVVSAQKEKCNLPLFV